MGCGGVENRVTAAPRSWENHMKFVNAIVVAVVLFFAVVGGLFTAGLIGVGAEELTKSTEWVICIDDTVIQAKRRLGKWYVNDHEVIINVPYVAVRRMDEGPKDPGKPTGKGSHNLGIDVSPLPDSVQESFRTQPDVLHPTL